MQVHRLGTGVLAGLVLAATATIQLATAAVADEWIMCEARFYKLPYMAGDSFILSTGNLTWEGKKARYWAVPDIASRFLANNSNVYMDNSTWRFNSQLSSFEFRCLSSKDASYDRTKIFLTIYNKPLTAIKRGKLPAGWLQKQYQLEDFSPTLAMCSRPNIEADWVNKIKSAVITANIVGWTPDKYRAPAPPPGPRKPPSPPKKKAPHPPPRLRRTPPKRRLSTI